ncbi:MAG: hypothetical protein AB7U73_21165 [Pirellulales bacterium]
MKMLMFFAVVAMLAASTLGCKSCGGCFSRGASCPACGQQPPPGCPPDGAYMPQGGMIGVPETFAPGPA